MMGADDSQRSLSDEATFAGRAPRRPVAEMSLGDQQTLGGGDRSGQDTFIDDIEVVDLEARYKVEGTLGQGGMGAVLLATDTRLDRKVAIKRILGEAAGNRMAVQRFLTEAKAIAALNHPNIVQIYDYGRAKDGPFLIMEYVDGGSLLDRCRESALPLEESIDLACQLCDGLAKAHDLKIIHRDIKPANVLLTRDGVPKLTDFGLAKAEAGDHGQTMTGAVLGTPDFMPPEQRRDASLVDHRSDLWSLAATVYQMATGRSPKIIRFDLLPAELTKVLGKALEDAKDARYQTARELRDALKTGLRTAAAAEELIEGACPACGVKNESSRRFCRGCGESLEAECLSCTKAMPMWEEICGSCGAKQAPLVAERREAMAARQAEAEGLLGDFEFDRAAAIAAELRDEPHRRLRYLTGWAGTFLGEVEKSRADQTRHAAEAMAEAAKHEAAYDYLSAVFTLESIPQSLRIGTLPGASEPAATALERVKSRQKEASGLESKVKSRLASKNLDDLLPTVERLLELQPDRQDVQKLRTQLRDRNEKLIAAGAAAFREAQALLDTHDYEGAVAALTPLRGVARSIEVEALQEQATGLLARTRDLIQRIREAVAAKRFEGLSETVEKYLTLKPADEEIQRLRQSLIERENRVLDEIAKRLEKARNHEQVCRFDDAAKILSGIPESRRSADIESWLERSERLAHLRERAVAVLSGCKAGEYGAALEQGTSYRTALASARFTDERFEKLWAKAETAHADEVRVKRLVRAALLAATGIAAAIVLAAAGLWIRSTIRATTLAEAIAQSRWDDALAIEPESVAALVGRARQRLGSDPADIDGAFADLDRAGGGGEPSPDLQRARADGHALRSRQQVRNERLEEAGQDFAEAKRLGASAELLATAQEALVAAWVARAQSASEKSDLSRLQTAVAAGLTAGASRERLLEVWETYAVRRIAELDVKGVQQACREGEKFGLSGEKQARWWLEIAEKAAQPPREDLAVVKMALEAAKAAGAVEERLLAVWETYAAGRIAELDVTGLKQACEEGGKFGLSGETQVRWWLEIAEKAAQPPREDLAVLKLALEAAKAAGASKETLAAPQSRQLLLEAGALVAAGDMRSATARAIEATLLDMNASVTTLKLPANQTVREAVVADYQGRFDEGLAGGDWDSVLRIAAAAGALDDTAAGWVGEAIAKHPGGLSAVPPEVLGRLPPATIAALPPAAVTALPPLRNSIGIKLTLIPPGRFTMGQAGGGIEKTPHQVTLTKPFYLGVYEVTNAQWKRVMGSVPSRWKDADRPVEQVSWEDAVEFCRKLSALPEERQAGRVYRLPTEAEWEYACRAGTDTKYSFGDDESRLDEYGWYDGNSGNQTHPVGKKKPNAWGLFDMHGNVWEWCSDWYGAYPEGAVTDPQGPSGASVRVSRGGCWDNSARNCRSAIRIRNDPSNRISNLGFRLALSPSGASPPEAEK